MEQLGFCQFRLKQTEWLVLRLILCQADEIDERSLLGIGDRLVPISSSNKTLFGKKVDFLWNTVKEKRYTRITTYLDMQECLS